MEFPSAVMKIPQNLSLINAVNFCSRLWNLRVSESVELDCSAVRHVEPFTMAYVSTEIRRFRERNNSLRIAFTNYKNSSYAAHMGFFKAAGIDFGNAPGQARGGVNYIPLTILNVGDIQREAVDSYEPVGNIIERRSLDLAKMLTQKETGELVDTLTYSLREIMRNVVEHSGSDVLEFCAQYWPTKKKIEIAVLDSGMGIKASLSSNPHLNLSSDRDAIHLALMPGISGKMFKGVRKRSNDVWQNSGFGLYMTNRIARNGGSFFLCSGKSGLLLTGSMKKDVPTNFSGTALRMVIHTEKIDDLASSLKKYRNEGYDLAKSYDPDRPIEPSIASTMLFRDFSKEVETIRSRGGASPGLKQGPQFF